MPRVACFGAILTCWAVASGAAPTTPTGAPADIGTIATSHFTISYPSRDAASIGAVAHALEREQARIVQELGSGEMPRVNVRIHADRAALQAAVASVAGVIPSWATGLATAVDQIHLLSPAAVATVVHEFGHCVSMRINPAIANNPRWLWEAVALYEARQMVNPRTLPYMTDGRPPSFASLSSFDNTLVYDVGYTIGEFIVSRGGIQALNRLIAANGNVESALGTGLAEFERGWFQFVRDRYGI